MPNFWWFSRILGQINLETMVVFMKLKKKFKALWHLAGPEGFSPSGFNFFFFALHETTMVSRFIAKLSVKSPKNKKQINETRAQKKNARSPLNTQ